MKVDLKRPNRTSKRKGSLEETISYAMYKDDPLRYTVSYRDKDVVRDANLREFMDSEEYLPIPLTRIVQISRQDRIVWKKGQKELAVKHWRAGL